MMNRLYNCKNPYQGSTKKVLCVCSAGLLRSPTLANILYQDYGYNTRACGADVSHALIPLDSVLIDWADEIVLVEPSLKIHIPVEFHPKVKVLDIPDSFEYMNPTLQRIIREQYKEVE